MGDITLRCATMMKKLILEKNEIVINGSSTNHMIARIPKTVRPTAMGAVKRDATIPEAMIKRIPSPPFTCFVCRHASMQMIRRIIGHQQKPTAANVHAVLCPVHGWWRSGTSVSAIRSGENVDSCCMFSTDTREQTWHSLHVASVLRKVHAGNTRKRILWESETVSKCTADAWQAGQLLFSEGEAVASVSPQSPRDVTSR